MSVDIYPEFYNDVFGPISNPGSSSHMSGPCRAGYIAHSMLGEDVTGIEILLDKKGSFSDGFGQMNEDLGMLNGAYGNLPDAPGFFDIKRTLDAKGISYKFEHVDLKGSKHPNAMKYVLTGSSGRFITMISNSTGGGMIEVVSVNGFKYLSKGDTWTILVFCKGTVTEDKQREISKTVREKYNVLSE